MPLTARPRVVDVLWLAAVLVASSAWCVTAARAIGATADEPTYVRLGLESWRTGSHGLLLRLGVMPLPADLCTLPLYAVERWRNLFWDLDHDWVPALHMARHGALAFWWALLVHVWLAARRLGGRSAGSLAVALVAFEPSFLGHAALATTDMALAAAVMALTYWYATGRHGTWWRRVGLPALLYGIVMLSKATGTAFGLFAVAAVEWASNKLPATVVNEGVTARATVAERAKLRIREAWKRSRRFRRDLLQVVAIGLAVVVVYCGSDWRVDPRAVEVARSLPGGGLSQTAVWVAERLPVSPNAIDGLLRQAVHNLRGHSPVTFVGGRWYSGPVWFYFPLILTIKLTLSLLALGVAAVVFGRRAIRNWASAAALVLLLVSLAIRVQLGVRLVLPLVALGVTGLSVALVAACTRTGPRLGRLGLTVAAVAAVAWSAWAAVRVWPHGLCYTNEFWGATTEGYRYVADSNYDWGQGLPELARWQRERGIDMLDVWYFGTDPMMAHLSMRELPQQELAAGLPQGIEKLVRGRYLAASTTLVMAGLGGREGQVRTAALLRARTPAARTTTFLIYDFEAPVR